MKDLKPILENLTSYFDSLFKDSKTKIIILCIIFSLVVVGIVSCFAITSSAEESPTPPQPNTGVYINEFYIYPGFVENEYENGSIYDSFGLIQTSTGWRGFDTVLYAYRGDEKVLAFSLNGGVVHTITNSEYAYGIGLADELFGEKLQDSNGNVIFEVTLSTPYNLIGYWDNLGGWSCPSGYDSFYVNGRILDSNWQPYGTTFSEFYIGYNDYEPTRDYIMFLGPRGPYSIDNQTPVFIEINSISGDSTWYDNVLLSWVFAIGGCDFYDTPPNMTLVKSGYYYLVDNPPLIDGVTSSLNEYAVDIDFTVPFSTNPYQSYSLIQFDVPTSSYNFEGIYYYLSGGGEVQVFIRDLSNNDSILNQDYKYIKIESDILIDSGEYALFNNFFDYSSDDAPFIDYETGFDDGYNFGLSESFIANFFEGIVKALDQLTIFYGFSFLTIIQTILGFSVLLWILKLIAGG